MRARNKLLKANVRREKWEYYFGVMNFELQKHKLDQIMQEKHENFSGQTYSFLEVKLRHLRRKT